MEKIGYLFPGQGAQFVGMGKDLYERYGVARQTFEAADRLLGYSITRICFEGTEEQITRTLYAQPAIYVTSVAALRVLEEKFPGIQPSFAAGLSLGEFTALAAARAISFEDGLKLVAARAAAMEKAAENHPGTMASILGMEQEACEALAREAGCQLANLNSPGQFVLSGTVQSIDRACELAEDRGAKRAIKLKVGGAFHSELMQSAREELQKALESTPITQPVCSFVPNATAIITGDPNEIRSLLSVQLTSPVRWIETMAQAAQSPVKTYLEIGPGKVLKGLAKKCQPELSVIPCGTVDDVEKMELLTGQTNT